MPINRHMTWGDRQAEVARDKNLAKLRKLAAMAPKPTEAPAEEAPQPAVTTAKPAKAAAKKNAAKKAATKGRSPARKSRSK